MYSSGKSIVGHLMQNWVSLNNKRPPGLKWPSGKEEIIPFSSEAALLLVSNESRERGLWELVMMRTTKSRVTA